MGNTPGITLGKASKPELEILLESSGVLALLEKQVGQTTVEDISGALEEYSRLFKAGIASPAEILTLYRAYPNDKKYSRAAARIENDPVVVGGPASVEMIDREGHLITTNALHKAFDKYMSNFRTRNAMVLHSDVQIGWALPAYISKGGQIFKSGVNDQGLFFITEVRDDTRIAQRVIEQINEGKLRSYSIAGSATKVQNMQKGLMPYMQVDDLELAEVTVCEKGVNQGANFDIIKGMTIQTQSCIDGSCLIKEHDDVIGSQTGKLGKDQVQYRDATEVEKNAGIMCGTCKYFNAGMSTCDLVNGMIMPGDWCSVFYPIDDSPVLENENNVREIMVFNEDGIMDYTKSFNNWIQKVIYTVDMGDVGHAGASELDLKFPGWRRDPIEYKAEIERLTTSQNTLEELNKAVVNKDLSLPGKKKTPDVKVGTPPPPSTPHTAAPTEQRPAPSSSGKRSFVATTPKTPSPSRGVGTPSGRPGTDAGGGLPTNRPLPPKELKSMKKSILDIIFKANGNGSNPPKNTTGNGARDYDPANTPVPENDPPEAEPQYDDTPDPDDEQRETWRREERYKDKSVTTSKALELFLKSEAMHTIDNVGGREAEHHQLLREYGFPSEQPPEAMRYIPVVETETTDWGAPINNKPPWVVNEAGQELGLSHIDDALHNLTKTFLTWMKKQRIPITADPTRSDMSRRQGQRAQGPKKRLNYGRLGQR